MAQGPRSRGNGTAVCCGPFRRGCRASPPIRSSQVGGEVERRPHAGRGHFARGPQTTTWPRGIAASQVALSRLLTRRAEAATQRQVLRRAQRAPQRRGGLRSTGSTRTVLAVGAVSCTVANPAAYESRAIAVLPRQDAPPDAFPDRSDVGCPARAGRPPAQPTVSSSTSKTSVASGGMTSPAPHAP